MELDLQLSLDQGQLVLDDRVTGRRLHTARHAAEERAEAAEERAAAAERRAEAEAQARQELENQLRQFRESRGK